MDPNLAFLESTKEFDTVALARNTQNAIEIIMPWCQMEASSTTVAISQEIRNQVQVYARAIDTSVEAAQMGFTIAEDAISLAESIKDSETKPEERREFLDGIISFTAQGLAKAKEARRGFLEVGTTVHNLLDQMKVENEDEAKVEYAEMSPNGLLNKIRKPFFEVKSELARGIKDLEEFGEMLSKFAAWWNGMVWETQSQLVREQQVGIYLEGSDKLRIRAIEQKWKNHKNRYAAYVNEIGIVQDRYPKLLKGADPSSPTAIPNPVTERSDPQINQPLPLRTHNTVLSQEYSSSCYVCASMTTVQVLEKNKCFLMLEFQWQASTGRRFEHMLIKWNFKHAYGSHPPLVLYLEPRQSPRARNNQNNHWMAMHSYTKEDTSEVEQTMIITGSICGQRQDSVEWTLEEDSSAMSGIPSRFCVAAVIQYTGPFLMDVEVRAKQYALNMMSSSRSDFHPIHAKSDAWHIDAEVLERQYEPYKPSHSWREWFPLFTGVVEVHNNGSTSISASDINDRPRQSQPAALPYSSNVLHSGDVSPSGYVSASMTTVQVLEKNKCLLILEFQCHTSAGRRFDHMSIKWNFKDAYSTHPPMVLQISPRQSTGARNEENHHRTYVLKVPVQSTIAGDTAGPEATPKIETRQKVERAMSITGSIRGQRQDSAEWTLEENSSAMSGIPSHFCVAAVIQYTGPFFMDVAIRAKQRASTMFGLSRRAFHDIQAKSGLCHIDADNLQRQYEPYKPSANWKQWFPLISGEVEGSNFSDEDNGSVLGLCVDNV